MLMIELLLPTFGRLVLVCDDVGHLTSLRSSIVKIHIILLHVWVNLILHNEVLRYLGLVTTFILIGIVFTINKIVLILFTASSSSCESGVRVIVLAIMRRSNN